MAGLTDGGSLGLFQVISPLATTNLVTNPSFETNTTGWTATSSTLTRTAGAGVFGVYGGRLLASGTNGRAGFTAASVASGTSVVASAWVKADSASVQIKLTIGASSNTQAHPGDGAWHRIEVAVTAPSTTTPVVEIIDTRTSAWTNVDIDAVQIETGVSVATTYVDGDQEGCTWGGTAHASTSARDGRDGRGGQLIALESSSVILTAMAGVGAPDVDVNTQRLALADGEVFQRSVMKPRIIALTMALVGGSVPTGLHTIRAGLTDLFRLDTRSNRGPVTLRYAGSATTKRISTYYDAGLEWGNINGQTEDMTLRLLAPDPSWYGETETATSVSGSQNVTVSRVAQRAADGSWGNMAGGATAPSGTQRVYQAAQMADGQILVASDLALLGGSSNLFVWNGTAWANLGTGSPNGVVTGLTALANGDVYIVGNFTSVGAVSANRIAKYTASTGVWSALGTGLNAQAYGVVVGPSSGYVYVSGSFTTANGVAVAGLAYWNGTTFVAGGGGVVGDTTPQALAVGPDGRIYLATGNAGGLDGVYVASDGSGAFALLATVSNVLGLMATPDALYIHGSFTTCAGLAIGGVCRYQGSRFEALGAAPLYSGGTQPGQVWSMSVGPDGTIYASGFFTQIGTIAVADPMAAWNGSAWTAVDANTPAVLDTTGDIVHPILATPDGRLTLGWFQSTGAALGTTLTAPTITSLTNPGSGVAYPVITITGASQLISIVNLTTNQAIQFAPFTTVNVGTITLDLRPGRKTMRGTFANLTGSILPGSNLVSWYLAPGVNRVAIFTDASAAIGIRFVPAFWSAD